MISVADAKGCAAIATLALLAGCGGGAAGGGRDARADLQADIQPFDRQDPRAAICATAEADGVTAAPPFEVIQQIFSDNCVSCHSPGADLDLSPAVAWTNLVGRPSPEACGGTLVLPGDPTMSYLYQKLSSAQPCFGERMPRTEFAPDPLPDCVVALVRNWISAGAPGPDTDGGAAD